MDSEENPGSESRNGSPKADETKSVSISRKGSGTEDGDVRKGSGVGRKSSEKLDDESEAILKESSSSDKDSLNSYNESTKPTPAESENKRLDTIGERRKSVKRGKKGSIGGRRDSVGEKRRGSVGEKRRDSVGEKRRDSVGERRDSVGGRKGSIGSRRGSRKGSIGGSRKGSIGGGGRRKSSKVKELSDTLGSQERLQALADETIESMKLLTSIPNSRIESKSEIIETEKSDHDMDLESPSRHKSESVIISESEITRKQESRGESREESRQDARQDAGSGASAVSRRPSEVAAEAKASARLASVKKEEKVPLTATEEMYLLAEIEELLSLYDRSTGAAGRPTVEKKDMAKLLRCLGYNPSESEVWEHTDPMPGDRVGLDDVLKVMEAMERTGESREELLEAFEYFDKDMQGALAPDDLRLALVQHGEPLDEDDLEALIEYARTEVPEGLDGHGQIKYGHLIDALMHPDNAFDYLRV